MSAIETSVAALCAHKKMGERRTLPLYLMALLVFGVASSFASATACCLVDPLHVALVSESAPYDLLGHLLRALFLLMVFSTLQLLILLISFSGSKSFNQNRKLPSPKQVSLGARGRARRYKYKRSPLSTIPSWASGGRFPTCLPFLRISR